LSYFFFTHSMNKQKKNQQNDQCSAETHTRTDKKKKNK